MLTMSRWLACHMRYTYVLITACLMEKHLHVKTHREAHCSFHYTNHVIRNASSCFFMQFLPHHFIIFACSFSPDVNLLATLTRFFSPFIFVLSFVALAHAILHSIFLVTSSLWHIENGHCSLGYPDPLGACRALLPNIQPFGDTSYDRRVRNCCHAECGIIMLNACRRCDSCAFSCI